MSFGHAAYFGLGAYGAALLLKHGNVFFHSPLGLIKTILPFSQIGIFKFFSAAKLDAICEACIIASNADSVVSLFDFMLILL